MKLQQVQYFLALCEEKHFTRAAKRCGVSQPSLSNAIKQLEQELGGQLFHRGPVNSPLSELGQAVRPHLAKLDQCAREARRQAAHFSTPPQAAATALERVSSITRPLIHPENPE
jgi:DNA-binding transcriptional LysR family regulator